VIGETSNGKELERFFSGEGELIDVILLDTDLSWSREWNAKVVDLAQSLKKPPRVLYLGTNAEERILQQVAKAREFGGYALKGEILYALASGVAYIAEGKRVVTPGIKQLALETRVQLPDDTLVLNGTKGIADFTKRESEIVRLGILFNLAQRDVADELVVSPEWVSEVVSNAYGKLGLREILSGEVTLETYFDDPAILARWHSVLGPEDDQIGDGAPRKTPWMATLAYHLLTIPEVTEL
jgi:DNA-binding NarL/FixJ family response regulator